MTSWLPGDPGAPTHADSKEELISFCPRPEGEPCPSAECDHMCFFRHIKDLGRWRWAKTRICKRCRNLLSYHGLELTELIALWENQDRQCYNCGKPLQDPRLVTIGPNGHGRREAKVDHDHKICPERQHSCKRCRRGLACSRCNAHELALRLGHLPEDPGELHRWLRFLSPEERRQLSNALSCYLLGGDARAYTAHDLAT